MRVVLYVAFLLCLLTACNHRNTGNSQAHVGKHGIKYGGVFKFNETEYYRSLYPLAITEIVGNHIVSQIYEGLVGFNPDKLVLRPLLANSWTMDSTGTVYTFQIRTGVYFQDDPCFKNGKGRLLTAKDFAYCFGLVCKPDPKNQGYDYIRGIIKGADTCYNAWLRGEQPDSVSGIKALNDSVLQITLERPYAPFLDRLALPFFFVFPKEALDYYRGDIINHTVGTGPFVLKTVKPDEAVIMVRNPNYWGVDDYGNQLPYLDGIKMSFIKEDKAEMMEFRKGNLDMKYRLPFDMVDEILDENQQPKGEYKKFQFLNEPELTIQYYGFLVKDKLFADKNVRLAFNYAIDRYALANYTAKGEGIPADYGFVPPGIPGYDNKLVHGYTFDRAKAQAYLAKAGYPEGRGFPKVTLEINSGGTRNEKVAEAIIKMLKENLNVDVEITQLIWAQHTNNVETAKTNFWRFAWVADYPDPDDFLNLFYGKNVPATMEESSYTNPTRYVNPVYDSLYEKAIATPDPAMRNVLYVQLDQLIVDDAPCLLIYYSIGRKLVQPYVHNFYNNGMDFRYLRDVWMDK